MNYYPFHLGDYTAHTAHLEPLEDLAYRRMLDAYYLREGPLPADPVEVARLIRLRGHQAEVEAVLREFFEQDAAGWRHSRCDEEIERMQDKQAKARASAAASVNARKAKAQPTQSERRANAERTLNERSTDVELPTPTPTPIPKDKKQETPAKPARFDPLGVDLPNGVSQDVWSEWIAYRRKRKLTTTEQTVKAQVAKLAEFAAAGHDPAEVVEQSILQGWQGLFAPKDKAGQARRIPARENFEAVDYGEPGVHDL
jgi:uncharacterized protein YdaU (DUF1376 family)